MVPLAIVIKECSICARQERLDCLGRLCVTKTNLGARRDERIHERRQSVRKPKNLSLQTCGVGRRVCQRAVPAQGGGGIEPF